MCVVSYRSHHHAYDPKDPNVTFIDYAKPLTAPRRLLQFIFTSEDTRGMSGRWQQLRAGGSLAVLPVPTGLPAA